MKKLLILLSILTCSIAAFAQGPNSFGGIALRVNDTTTYQSNAAAFHTAGYYDIYFNNQATNDHWDVWNGSSYDHVFAFGFPLKYVFDQVSVSTAGGTITFDCNSQIARAFVGSASFSAPKTLALSNTTNTVIVNFKLNITDVAAVLTFPSDWTMIDLSWNGTTWTPPQTGRYEFAGSWDSVNSLWDIKVKGPFTN